MTPSSGHFVWMCLLGTLRVVDHSPIPRALQARWKSTVFVLYKVHTNVISSPKGVPWASLVDLCQRRSGQLDSGPCKQPSSVPFFAMRYLEMHSIKPVLSSAWIQPEAQSTDVPGSFSNPQQHKTHWAELEWMYFWKHWLVLF